MLWPYWLQKRTFFWFEYLDFKWVAIQDIVLHLRILDMISVETIWIKKKPTWLVFLTKTQTGIFRHTLLSWFRMSELCLSDKSSKTFFWFEYLNFKRVSLWGTAYHVGTLYISSIRAFWKKNINLYSIFDVFSPTRKDVNFNSSAYTAFVIYNVWITSKSSEICQTNE